RFNDDLIKTLLEMTSFGRIAGRAAGPRAFPILDNDDIGPDLLITEIQRIETVGVFHRHKHPRRVDIDQRGILEFLPVVEKSQPSPFLLLSQYPNERHLLGIRYCPLLLSNAGQEEKQRQQATRTNRYAWCEKYTPSSKGHWAFI